MNALDRNPAYLPFKKQLCRTLGNAYGRQLWKEAGQYYACLLAEEPTLTRQKGAMVLPGVSLYAVLTKHGEDAEAILCSYGKKMEQRMAKAVHAMTSLPGIPDLIWKHIAALTDTMSSASHGYERELVSEPPYMYGVNILSCPYHQLALKAGVPDAVHWICAMDKEYMKGFCGIRYERSQAVSEGAPYCDYRLSRKETQ
ncbi:MAG: L-2-amino-thiazoline-4-carboxylic acid hydrolase [Solobacterium sp.]|nr:L-2-amino-thiazoline-4-carboxylic acid hydrolase [Solobacterium sp.]